jgi:hypothetical protein
MAGTSAHDPPCPLVISFILGSSLDATIRMGTDNLAPCPCKTIGPENAQSYSTLGASRSTPSRSRNAIWTNPCGRRDCALSSMLITVVRDLKFGHTKDVSMSSDEGHLYGWPHVSKPRNASWRCRYATSSSLVPTHRKSSHLRCTLPPRPVQ